MLEIDYDIEEEFQTYLYYTTKCPFVVGNRVGSTECEKCKYFKNKKKGSRYEKLSSNLIKRNGVVRCLWDRKDKLKAIEEL